MGRRRPQSFHVLLPPGVDLVVLDHAPLELAGRIALDGVLLFDDDPPARVRWLATAHVHGHVAVDDRIVLDRLSDLSDVNGFVNAITSRLGHDHMR